MVPKTPLMPSLASTRALARGYRVDLQRISNKGAQRLVVLLNEIERLEREVERLQKRDDLVSAAFT